MQTGQNLLQAVSKLRDIPTLSVVVGNVIESLNDPRKSASQIAQILKRDQVLSARVLRLVNSSFFGRSATVSDIPKALSFLGDNTLSTLVLGTSVFTQADLEEHAWFDVVEFWRHSLGTGLAAEFIARKINHPRPEEFFTSGLLHDIGILALFRVDREALKRAICTSLEAACPLLEAEQSLGLPGHTVLGETLAQQWNLPLSLRKAIRYHHRDIRQFSSIHEDDRTIVMITTLAQAMARRLQIGSCGDETRAEYPQSYIEPLGLDSATIEALEMRLSHEMSSASRVLDLVRPARLIRKAS